MVHDHLLPILTDDELRRRFAKIKPRMTETEAMVESSRCLFCHDAPCIKACPATIDIPLFIRQIMSKDLKGSAQTILSQNILGTSCGEVCPTEVLCEGACVYHGMNKNPINIGRLQSYATRAATDSGIHFFQKGTPTGKRVAVIGGGPAGLACAHELTVLGHEAVVFEASAQAGGLNTYGVAPYKFSNTDAAQEVAYLQAIGFEIKTNHRVTAEELQRFEQQYDALFLGLGLGNTRRPGVPGENKQGVFGAAEFIYRLREKEQRITIGKKVIVIGGGNTAIDAAVESAKLGAEVTILYRRTEKDQSAYAFEVELAKRHGVQFCYRVALLEIVGNRDVTGVRCVRTEEEVTFACDMVILATGQEKLVSFLATIPNLTLEAGRVKVNNDFQTTNPKYFAGGDAVNGGKEVVNAVAHGRDAARGIDRWLRRKTEL